MEYNKMEYDGRDLSLPILGEPIGLYYTSSNRWIVEYSNDRFCLYDTNVPGFLRYNSKSGSQSFSYETTQETEIWIGNKDKMFSNGWASELSGWNILDSIDVKAAQYKKLNYEPFSRFISIIVSN